MVRPSSWFFGGAPGRTTEERLGAIVERLQDLESLVETVHRDLAFGPLDSQYLSLTLGADETAGTALPNGALDRLTFPFEADVVLVQFTCLGGDATVNLTYGSSVSLFASPPIALVGSSVFFNEATDFSAAPLHISGNLTLSKVSTDAGTPNQIRARVILKGVSQIEPT